jgi:hypothetical protein
MPIPETQLETWSHQGATAGSENTHQSIRVAFKEHAWPPGMTYKAYLQGSYPNATNIRGNSDVDLVIESSAVFYSNLTDAEKQAKALQPGAFSWSNFRDEVERALVAYYGRASVQPGNKSIKLIAGAGRLPADVIPAVEYREYHNGSISATGLTFWARHTNEQIINFPKLHLTNGAQKNLPLRANGRYKPAIRMLKNAREIIISGDAKLRKRYPSYFLECLAYNAADSSFSGSFQEIYTAVVDELNAALLSRSNEFICQNEQRLLFGTASTQWHVENARAFINELVKLWNR